MVFGVAVAHNILGLYFENFGDLPNKRFIDAAATWGQFGDFVGGTINPAIGIITIILLFIGIVIQRIELESGRSAYFEQSRAIQLANFEHLCFGWFKNYQNLLSEIASEENEKRICGRQAMFTWYKKDLSADKIVPLTSHPEGEYQDPIKGARRTIGLMGNDVKRKAVSDAVEKYEELYKAQEYQLDSLYRTLYRLVKWIDELDYLSQEEKWFYISMLRAQLSWVEMVFILYNGLTLRGSSFRDFIDKYALFDNLNVSSDPILELIQSFSRTKSSFYKSQAFDSALARRALGLPEFRKNKQDVHTPV